jgi:hypothetical protein
MPQYVSSEITLLSILPRANDIKSPSDRLHRCIVKLTDIENSFEPPSARKHVPPHRWLIHIGTD